MGNKLNFRQIILKTVVFGIFLVLTTTPLVMMYKLSLKEQQQYVQDTQYTFREAAYGGIVSVCREDLEQYYVVDGKCISNTYKNIKINSSASSNVYVDVQEEIFEGQVIAKIDGKDLVSTLDGIVEDVVEGEEGYIKVLSFSNPELMCNVSPQVAKSIKGLDSLVLEDGRKVKVKSISNIMIDNNVQVVFEIEDCEYMYGEDVSDLKIFTGRRFSDILVVDKSAVYKRLDGNYYVRTVDESGYFIDEVQVNVSYEVDDKIVITGVEEGTLCDSGYASCIEYEELEEEY